MIPKIIHYCWFGGQPKPEMVLKCIESWKKYCPDWEIIEWNESNFDVSSHPYMKEAYERKMWAFVSDVARLLLVYNYGGIYLDTDVELHESLNELLIERAFFAFESDVYINTGVGFGCEKGHKSVETMLHYYDKRNFIKNGKINTKPCPVGNTEALKDTYAEFVSNGEGQKFADIRILSVKEYQAIATHHGASSWCNPARRSGPYKDTWLKRIMRNPSRVEKIEKIFGRRIVHIYIFIAYDFLENGMFYFLKRLLKI